MHFPFQFNIGNTPVLWHSLIEPLAMFTGFRYYLQLRKGYHDPISSYNRIRILIGAILGAIIGSRLIGGLENPPALLAAGNKLLYFYHNKTVLGGFLGGLWCVELTRKLIGEKNSSGDLFTYPMILALMLGRLGCFSMGVYEETYGTETRFFTGMNLGDGKCRHPVALYEIVFLLLLWLYLQKTEHQYQLAPGLRFKLFLITYCLFRFTLDFIKPHYTFATGLSTIQMTAIVGLLYYAVIFINDQPLFSFKIKSNA